MNFKKIVDENKDLMIETLRGLLQIKSVLDYDTVSKNAPFGKGINEALNYMLDLAKKDGFEVVNDSGYAGHISYGNNPTDMVGILCHLDVVPEGNNWTYPPYQGVIKDGKIYARGSIDDKGPTLATYFALKIIKDANIKLKKEIRIILGTDEETGWRGVSHYFDRYPMPGIGFSPDASFPLVYGEKGRMSYDLSLKHIDSCDIQNDIIVSMNGGERYNVVLDHIETLAKVDLSKEFLEYLDKNNLSGDAFKEGNLYRYVIEGVGAHAMEPEKGINAGTYMCDFFKDYTKNGLVKYIADMHHLAFFMEKHGLDYCDYEMGPITCNIGIIDINKETSRVTLDLRYPTRYDLKKFNKVMNEIFNKYDIYPTQFSNKEPHYIAPDSKLVTKLYESYVKYSNDHINKPITIGGGTYASMMPNAVAFGVEMPGEEVLAHQRNEYLSLDVFFMSVLIYIDAIIALGELDA